MRSLSVLLSLHLLLPSIIRRQPTILLSGMPTSHDTFARRKAASLSLPSTQVTPFSFIDNTCLEERQIICSSVMRLLKTSLLQTITITFSVLCIARHHIILDPGQLLCTMLYDVCTLCTSFSLHFASNLPIAHRSTLLLALLCIAFCIDLIDLISIIASTENGSKMQDEDEKRR